MLVTAETLQRVPRDLVFCSIAQRSLLPELSSYIVCVDSVVEEAEEPVNVAVL